MPKNMTSDKDRPGWNNPSGINKKYEAGDSVHMQECSAAQIHGDGHAVFAMNTSIHALGSLHRPPGSSQSFFA